MRKKKDRLFHSLAVRILLIALILLVLPLFFHNLFLYWQDYQEKKDNLFLNLKIVGNNKSYDVFQYVDSEKKFLSWISTQELNEDLLERAQFEEKLSKLYFIDSEGKQILNPSEKLPFIDADYLENLKHYDNFLTEDTETKVLDIPVPVKNDGKFIGFLISRTPIESLKKELFQTFTFPYAVEISFHENEFAPFPNSQETDTFSAKENGESVFVKRVPFSRSNFSLYFIVQEEEVSDLSVDKVLKNIVYLTGFFVVFGGIFVFIIARRMYKPMKHLLSVIDKIFYYDLDARYTPDKMGFEINILGEHFNKMIDSVFHYQTEMEKFRLEQEALKKELEIGTEIQQSLFPKTIPSLKNVDIEGKCLQAKEVGGDFFDLFLVGNKLVFCVADAAGKGISACLYSLGIRSLLRSTLSKEPDLKIALENVNALFHEDVGESGVFTTLWIGVLDTNSNELTYSSLGHHPVLLKRGGEVQELNTQSNALGPFEDVFIETKTCKLHTNDNLLLFTDGVVDCQNEKEEFFGYDNIVKYFSSHKSFTAKEYVASFLDHLKEYSKDHPLFDDLTILSLFIKK